MPSLGSHYAHFILSPSPNPNHNSVKWIALPVATVPRCRWRNQGTEKWVASSCSGFVREGPGSCRQFDLSTSVRTLNPDVSVPAGGGRTALASVKWFHLADGPDSSLQEAHLSTLPSAPLAYLVLTSTPGLVQLFAVVEARPGTVLKVLRGFGDLTIKNTETHRDKVISLLILFLVF